MRALLLGGPNDGERLYLTGNHPPPQHWRVTLPEPITPLAQMIRVAYADVFNTATYELAAVGPAGAVYAWTSDQHEMAEDFAHDPEAWGE